MSYFAKCNPNAATAYGFFFGSNLEAAEQTLSVQQSDQHQEASSVMRAGRRLLAAAHRGGGEAAGGLWGSWGTPEAPAGEMEACGKGSWKTAGRLHPAWCVHRWSLSSDGGMNW